MGGIATLRLLRTESFYAFRALLRDSPLCQARMCELLENERLSREELDKKNRLRLLRSLKAARRRLLRYRDIKMNFSVDDVHLAIQERFPCISKEDLLTHPNLFYPNEGRAWPWNIVGRTSGTTGTPLTVVRSFQSIVWENAFLRRHWSWAGFRSGMKRATLRGDYVVSLDTQRPPFWFYNRYNSQLIISSRHLRDPFFEHIADELERFSPYLLQAYPSTAYDLACFLRDSRRQIAVPFVFTGSEPLYPFQRELIAERFKAKVMDFYGMAERAIFASECEYGGLHVNSDYSWVEIVDEYGQPTNDEGFLVGTSYYNLLMPLVRYRLSDRTKWRNETCPCGRVYPLIEPVTGKWEDAIFGVDGRRISPSVLTFAFKGLYNINRAQVAQVSGNEWEVRIVSHGRFSEADRRKLIDNIHRLVEPDIRVRVCEVPDIPRTAAGKFRWVVNEYVRNKANKDMAVVR